MTKEPKVKLRIEANKIFRGLRKRNIPSLEDVRQIHGRAIQVGDEYTQ